MFCGRAAGEGGADTMAPLRNLFMGMPPMLDALAQQTNVQLPSFLPQVCPYSATPPARAIMSLRACIHSCVPDALTGPIY